jgi:NADH dehydrogenase/NADH:ubiquinone oxidoreductase subunit G
MSAPGPVFRPYERLVKITVKGKQYEVPDGNMLLRAFQFLAPETIPYGRFCWNEECQYCRVTYDRGEGTSQHVALACKLMVQDGMRIVDSAAEIKYCLRTLPAEVSAPPTGPSGT